MLIKILCSVFYEYLILHLKKLHGLGIDVTTNYDTLSTLRYDDEQCLPAVTMDLKHDFWSMRGHSTYRACGLMLLNASMHNISVIPVAMGTTNADVTAWTPTTVTVLVSTTQCSYAVQHLMTMQQQQLSAELTPASDK